MVYKYDSFEFKLNSLEKGTKQNRGKSREKIGRDYDEISKIIKKKFYL